MSPQAPQKPPARPRGRPRKDSLTINLTPCRHIVEEMRAWCSAIGMTQTAFIEGALLEKFERLERDATA